MTFVVIQICKDLFIYLIIIIIIIIITALYARELLGEPLDITLLMI